MSRLTILVLLISFLLKDISQVKWEIHNAAQEELKALIEENKM